MKNPLLWIGRLVILFLPFCIISCDGCQSKIGPWVDEHTVDIPKEDKTPPAAWFEITDSKTGETIRAEEDLTIVKANGTNLSVVFFGKDEESGIKKLCLTGGSYKKCCSTNLNPRLCSITQPLIVPNCTEIPLIDTRALISWFMITEIPLSMNCDENWELESGSYGLIGTVTNSMNVETHITLSITVEE